MLVRTPRVVLGPVVVLAAVAAPSAAASWVPHVRDAVAYAHARKGEVRFAVRTERHVWGFRRTNGVHSASVVKALLLVAYLDHPSVQGRPLSAADHRLIDPVIRRSDNGAADRVLALVGARRVEVTARRVGMRRFRLNPIVWGGSRIDASDQTRFFQHHRQPDHAYGKQTLHGVFARLLRGLEARLVLTPL